MSKYTYNKDFFKKIDNEEKAYWLGFLYADGCITRFYKNEKIKSMSLELTLCEKDKEHLIKFLNSLNANLPLQEKIINLNNKKYKAFRLVVNCTSMCRDLIKLGCTPQKSLTLTFPNNKIVPKYLQKHFIRGYLDGDGCVFYKDYRELGGKQQIHNINFVGTKEFLESLKNYFDMEYVITKKGNTFQIAFNSYHAFIKIYDMVYKNSTIFLQRKNDIFKKVINKS